MPTEAVDIWTNGVEALANRHTHKKNEAPTGRQRGFIQLDCLCLLSAATSIRPVAYACGQFQKPIELVLCFTTIHVSPFTFHSSFVY